MCKNTLILECVNRKGQKWDKFMYAHVLDTVSNSYYVCFLECYTKKELISIFIERLESELFCDKVIKYLNLGKEVKNERT